MEEGGMPGIRDNMKAPKASGGLILAGFGYSMIRRCYKKKMNCCEKTTEDGLTKC